ncbi:response regulator [Oscillatoria sp. CS-180]|uniref:response regulator n=1 Tax=Oscillatoria sp. CS-180 TaxID=3021720 RepID=UPI00232BA5A1|nr:response regulator [Oscillatoria sp. CS-180]MDB9528299.1 response regulator [Oscillatoria sp. CS-180]
MTPTELTQLLDPPNKRFDGHLILNDDNAQWTLSFVKGQLLYVADQLHAVRRWNRVLKQFFPNWNWPSESLTAIDPKTWQLALLDQGVQQQQLSLIRAKLLIRKVTQECLFELSHRSHLQSDWQPRSLSISRACHSIALSVWEVKMTLSQVENMQQQWQAAKLERLSPDLSPVLKKGAPTECLPVPSQYLNGKLTLWDVADQKSQSVTELIQSLLPLVDKGFLEFQSIPDIPLPQIRVNTSFVPVAQSSSQSAVSQVKSPQLPLSKAPVAPPKSQANASESKAVVACIDDSPVLAHTLKKILESAGYEALTIQEPMRGFSELIEHQPSLILLDLMLPNADGYSVCKFLRDTPVFEKTPIIILTGKNKPIDRARARLAGATEFLVKPPQPEELIQMIEKHLQR